MFTTHCYNMRCKCVTTYPLLKTNMWPQKEKKKFADVCLPACNQTNTTCQGKKPNRCQMQWNIYNHDFHPHNLIKKINP